MKNAILTTVITINLALAAGSAYAANLSSLARGVSSAPSFAFIKNGQPTLAPFAHVKFCMENPDECRASDGSTTVSWTAAMQRKIREINDSINRTIIGINDTSADDYADDWKVNVKQGDCEDFALSKRDQLIASGIPARALRIAVTRTPSGEGHAVLVVKTTRGDLVLDNRTNRIKNWRKTDLQWVKIQSGDNPRMWYDI
ncbi:transglutaminase-like cysteine peptidase [Rhizobium sp. 007]|uniref:transglutaminase-like cysteine peptidase n=1 Tax=Rhizobium sp. 007 TaxID=2785056 RepID=UPI00188FC21E|nr:transglutaminase-like cysteine peptidase [Rhizobium sp. 007]QPB22377.1 transglutaminase-like cysteine peptidase [Rhizobium sp. 007]